MSAAKQELERQHRSRENMPDQKARDRARRLAEKGARVGRSPRETYPAADLRWAFRGHEDELELLERVALEYNGEKAARLERREQARAVQDMTAHILAEQEREAEAERRAAAEALAKERLGIK
jgi:hypothetical protein